VDASVPGQLYMGCCRNLFLTPITPILGMQHLCCLCEIHMSNTGGWWPAPGRPLHCHRWRTSPRTLSGAPR
jgi:hypothetical protein